jgi:hypothetical protein
MEQVLLVVWDGTSASVIWEGTYEGRENRTSRQDRKGWDSQCLNERLAVEGASSWSATVRDGRKDLRRSYYDACSSLLRHPAVVLRCHTMHKNELDVRPPKPHPTTP